MFPIKEFEKRFGEILDALDALAEGGDWEELEDLNAELEDTLMLLSELRGDDDDWRQEFSGAMEELIALAGDYRALKMPKVEDLARRLEAQAEMGLGSVRT